MPFTLNIALEEPRTLTKWMEIEKQKVGKF